MMWGLHWDAPSRELTWHYGGNRGDRDRPTPWQVSVLKAYAKVRPFMTHREILPDGRGVVYRHENTLVLWASREFEYGMETPGQIGDVLGNTDFRGDRIQARRLNVYRVIRS